MTQPLVPTPLIPIFIFLWCGPNPSQVSSAVTRRSNAPPITSFSPWMHNLSFAGLAWVAMIRIPPDPFKWSRSRQSDRSHYQYPQKADQWPSMRPSTLSRGSYFNINFWDLGVTSGTLLHKSYYISYIQFSLHTTSIGMFWMFCCAMALGYLIGLGIQGGPKALKYVYFFTAEQEPKELGKELGWPLVQPKSCASEPFKIMELDAHRRARASMNLRHGFSNKAGVQKLRSLENLGSCMK